MTPQSRITHILSRCRVVIVQCRNVAGVHVIEKHYLDPDGLVVAIDVTTRAEL
jgi:hypothetical protein